MLQYKLAVGPIDVAFTQQYHIDISHIFQVKKEDDKLWFSTRFKGVASHVNLEQFLNSITATVGQHVIVVIINKLF